MKGSKDMSSQIKIIRIIIFAIIFTMVCVILLSCKDKISPKDIVFKSETEGGILLPDGNFKQINFNE